MMKLIGLLLGLVLFASNAKAQTQSQFPTAPWGGFAPGKIECGWLYDANFNSTADQAIPISVPSALYVVDSILVTNASVSLTTAAGGVYSAVSKGGVAVVSSGQAFSGLTSNTANTTGNALALTIATAGNTTAFQGFAQTGRISTLYLSLTTGQGAAATADFRVYCRPLF